MVHARLPSDLSLMLISMPQLGKARDCIVSNAYVHLADDVDQLGFDGVHRALAAYAPTQPPHSRDSGERTSPSSRQPHGRKPFSLKHARHG